MADVVCRRFEKKKDQIVVSWRKKSEGLKRLSIRVGALKGALVYLCGQSMTASVGLFAVCLQKFRVDSQWWCPSVLLTESVLVGAGLCWFWWSCPSLLLTVSVRVGVSVCRQSACRRAEVLSCWGCRFAGSGFSLVGGRRAKTGVVGQGQSTTMLFITLEVANSKAKSEGIQTYCYI